VKAHRRRQGDTSNIANQHDIHSYEVSPLVLNRVTNAACHGGIRGDEPIEADEETIQGSGDSSFSA
jgi:hypothetical protein